MLLIFCHGRDGLLKAPLTVSMMREKIEPVAGGKAWQDYGSFKD